MNRRDFLQALGVTVGALPFARFLPTIETKPKVAFTEIEVSMKWLHENMSPGPNHFMIDNELVQITAINPVTNMVTVRRGIA